VIDDHAPIFQLCATGKYNEVNRMLSLGEATIADVNCHGETLLHVGLAYLVGQMYDLISVAGCSDMLAA
jgi:hypothetical protein